MPRSQTGMSLLEVLVALLILSIALTAASRAIGVAATQAGTVRDRFIADWIAQNRLAEHRAFGHWLPVGIGEGEVTQGDIRFRYRETVQSTPNALFRRIEVTVFRADSEDQLTRLSGYLVRGAR